MDTAAMQAAVVGSDSQAGIGRSRCAPLGTNWKACLLIPVGALRLLKQAKQQDYDHNSFCLTLLINLKICSMQRNAEY